ncbi:VOC family protein [Novosphingobium flavum]|uniref:VOC family protein n=1 Tax=Novosphingobium flavum TaxID=1778672 RepID=A0A7X1FUY8_9SPHN|nr:VOC family protein [Novosphingobium flavum]MBC2666832.1 VOC family protein [Novosphingobium flavum]
MPVIKARNIAWCRLRAPDLDVMEQFLTDFGLVRAERTETALYMRGTGPRPFIHVTEQGPAGFIGFAYEAESAADLEKVAQLPGASGIEDLEVPGGGRRVVLREPNGYQIEVVHGMGQVAPIAPEPLMRRSFDPSMRKGAARVVRLAHGVFATPDPRATLDWFHETLGFIKTDELWVGDKFVGGFYRVDAGEDPVDHHVIFCNRNERAGMHHVSFEVQDVNDVFFGHNHLKMAGRDYEHIRGISRHALGSQIFDYWMSPYDQMHEHWSSNERFNSDSAANDIQIAEGLQHEGGEKPSERFVKQSTP